MGWRTERAWFLAPCHNAFENPVVPGENHAFLRADHKVLPWHASCVDVLPVGQRSVVLAMVMMVCVATGCTLDTPQSTVQAQRHAIVGGVPTQDDPATVLLESAAGECSGVLITPRVVLTARHCLLAEANALTVAFGASRTSARLRIGVDVVLGHPATDLAALALRRAAPESIPLLPLNRRRLQSATGQAVRLVGFGLTQVGMADNGIKRSVLTSLRGLQSDPALGELVWTDTRIDASTCNGDSGGPQWMRFGGVEALVAITSGNAHPQATTGQTTPCGEGFDLGVRLDHYLPWIDAFTRVHDPASCAADRRCSSDCATPDPDCICAADGQCGHQCDDWRRDPDCQACAADGVCQQDCLGPDPDCDCTPPVACQGPDCVLSAQAHCADEGEGEAALTQVAGGVAGCRMQATSPVGACGMLLVLCALLRRRLA